MWNHPCKFFFFSYDERTFLIKPNNYNGGDRGISHALKIKPFRSRVQLFWVGLSHCGLGCLYGYISNPYLLTGRSLQPSGNATGFSSRWIWVDVGNLNTINVIFCLHSHIKHKQKAVSGYVTLRPYKILLGKTIKLQSEIQNCIFFICLVLICSHWTNAIATCAHVCDILSAWQ